MCSRDIQHKLENSHNHLLCSHILVRISTRMSETGRTITYTDVYHCGRRKNRYQRCREANIRAQILFFVSPSLLLSAPRHITRSWRCNDVLVWRSSSGLIKLLRGQNHLIWLNGPVDTGLRSEMLHYIRTVSFAALCSNWAALRSELHKCSRRRCILTNNTLQGIIQIIKINIFVNIIFFKQLFLSWVATEKVNITRLRSNIDVGHHPVLYDKGRKTIKKIWQKWPANTTSLSRSLSIFLTNQNCVSQFFVWDMCR